MTLLVSLAVSIVTYFGTYNRECQEAVTFADDNRQTIEHLLTYMPADRARMAMCVVAPEISQYSHFFDYAETYSLKILYVQNRTANFSIGPFQMKPSFAETIEDRVKRDANLKKRFGSLLITDGSPRRQRNIRVDRLSQLEWQIVYLAAFMDIAETRLRSEGTIDSTTRLKLLATLYNSGIDKPMSEIRRQMQIRRFPGRSRHNFNYADISAEFHAHSPYCPWLH